MALDTVAEMVPLLESISFLLSPRAALGEQPGCAGRPEQPLHRRSRFEALEVSVASLAPRGPVMGTLDKSPSGATFPTQRV